MEKVRIEKDIAVFYIAAKSFPEGIPAAFTELYDMLGKDKNRVYLGLSRGNESGGHTYLAAVEEKYSGEGKKLGCEGLVIKSGNYYSISIKDFMSNVQEIGNAFHEMLNQNDYDHAGYCIERYYNEKDVECLLRLKD